MSTIRANYSAALLSERLEALASQLAELEQLRDRVGREENRQREPVVRREPASGVAISQISKAHALARWWRQMG